MHDPTDHPNARLCEDLHAFALAEVDKFGAAPAGLFAAAPPGARPTDLMPDCRSVLAFAIKHLDVFTTTRDLDAQAYSQDITNREALHQAYRLSRFLERNGFQAFPMVASATVWPYAERGRGVAGRLSLRHAAQLAGLGRIGRNALLVTPEFGPRVQLGALLTDADLPATPLLARDPCTGCHACLDACPAGALRPPTPPAAYAPVDAEKCQAYREAHGGDSPLGYRRACGLCRAVCPVGRPKR